MRRTATRRGVFAGYPLINVEDRTVDGSYHPVDSSQVISKQTRSPALQEAVPKKAGGTLSEPIMKAVITAPMTTSATSPATCRPGGMYHRHRGP